MTEPTIFEQVVAEAPCLQTPAWWNETKRLCSADGTKHPRCALHALATDPRVREALVAKLEGDGVLRWGWHVDAILATLEPEKLDIFGLPANEWVFDPEKETP